jgi:hypothetical protein
MRVFGATFAVALAACSKPPPGPPAIGNTGGTGAREGRVEPGAYRCRIEEGGFEYPAFRCVIRRDADRVTLEKVEGSVRFRGVVAASTRGFRFDGELYCPWGDCTEPVTAEFRDHGGIYTARFNARRAGPPMLVTLEPSADDEVYGGDAYGGAAYGGYGYGGAMYGAP